MPMTSVEVPILSQFFWSVERNTGMPPQPLAATPEQRAKAEERDVDKQPLPKGVVLGPDGKPYVETLEQDSRA
jgi:FAD-linked sulfhydryl oxidase